MHVAVVLHVRRPVAHPELALEVRSDQGGRVFSTRTELRPGADQPIRVAFEIPALALLGGDYDLSLAAGERGVDPALDRTVGFSVAAEPGADGIVDLRGSWRNLEPARVGP
jgi:hypothetical protein